MLVSARQLKWLLRFYPPLFFQRVWVEKIAYNFSSITIIISKSIFNLNYNRSIFGGTIFCAADVCYPVLLHQFLSSKGYKVAVWSRSAEIHFLKKITHKLIFTINLSTEDMQQTELGINEFERIKRSYPIKIYNNKGEVCVNLKCEVYIRNLNFKKSDENLYE